MLILIGLIIGILIAGNLAESSSKMYTPSTPEECKAYTDKILGRKS